MVDGFLAGINLFNAFVLFTHLHPVESPFKKTFINAKLRVVSKVHSTPFLVSAILASLLCITTNSAMKYNVTNETAALVRAIVSAYTFACTSIFVKLTNQMIKLSVDRFLDLDHEAARRDAVEFVPPSRAVMAAVVAPYRPFLAVETTGMERIPDGVPHLFVSNHSLYGLEMPLLLNELYQKKGIFPRGLADHIHFATPNGPILRAFGAVDGTRENVDALMKAGHDVLVYPGGGHEVLKHSSVPRYELMWKERTGFARCAIRRGYTIVPCACVGTEDMFERVGDVPTGHRGMVVPVSFTTPCRIQKVYFWFGEPIPTEKYDGDHANDEYAREVRDRAKAAIEAGIRELREKQGSDPERYLVDRCASTIRSYFATGSPRDGKGNLEEDLGKIETKKTT